MEKQERKNVKHQNTFDSASLLIPDGWFKDIVEQCPFGVFLYDDSAIIWVNERMETILEKPAGQIIGRPIREFIDEVIQPEDLQVSAGTDSVVKYSEKNGSYRVMTIENKNTKARRFDVLIQEIQSGKEQIGCGFIMGYPGFNGLEKELQTSKKQLRLERAALRKKSIALDEILNNMDEYKAKNITKLAIYLEQQVDPIVQQLKELVTDEQLQLVKLLESDLKSITTGFKNRLVSQWSILSSRELQVCHMIRNGFTSKEIANSLGVCPSTIHKHRESIRKKLGIRNKRVNLNSYLRKM